jgi:arginyl-tRNA synthetase
MYVVATEQNLHFKQLFKVLELLERPYAKNMYHLSYGMVNLPTGKMKSREGTVVDADDLMDELEELAAEEVRKRHEDLSEKEVKKRAVIISLGALKFYMLKTDAVRDMVFNPEESLSFEGETGPYVQYTHARACSLLRKAGVQKATKINFNYLNTKEELALIKALYEFPEALNKAAEQYRPHVLCNYLIALSQSFNEFYHAHQVIVDNKEQMQARLLLVDCVRQVLENGLALLGIEAPEEM